MNARSIYLDHNASAPLLPQARSAVLDALDLVGNPSSVHKHGRALRDMVEIARSRVARLAGAGRDQVVFTASASEAITQAIVGGVKALGIDTVVVGATEHAAVLSAANASGSRVLTLGVDRDGLVRLEELSRILSTTQRALVSVQAVNNETGVLQPMTGINALVGPTPHYLFVDAVQAFGKCDLDFAASAADMMAVSGHKIGAPAGTGALLMKQHLQAVRLIPGGGQESGRRGGTEAAAMLAGFGAAAEAFPAEYEAAGVSALVHDLERRILALAPDAVIFGAGAERIGNVVNFAVPGVGSAVAMMSLDLSGISVSSGSACSSGKVGPSHVLAAMGVAPDLAGCALRVSFGWCSGQDDVEAFLAAFGPVLERHMRRQGRAA